MTEKQLLAHTEGLVKARKPTFTMMAKRKHPEFWQRKATLFRNGRGPEGWVVNRKEVRNGVCDVEVEFLAFQIRDFLREKQGVRT